MTGRTRAAVPWLLVVGVPVAVGVLGAVLLAGFRAELPDPVAVHWDTDGADGFAARDSAELFLALGPLLSVLLGGGIAVSGRREPVARRLGAGLACGLALFVTATVVGSLWQQRGLSDAAAAPEVDGLLAVALVAALATGPVPAEAPRLALAPGERAVWSGWATAPRAVLALLALSLLPPLVLAVLGVAPLFLGLLMLLLLPVVGATTAARVWADERGLTVRSPLGWPAYTVPLDEVAAATVVTVDPLRDFGGWGYKIGRGGRTGVVFRRGPALAVTRGDGRQFVVTVDGAADAAALLTALTARVRG